MRYALIVCLVASPAFSETCPAVPDHQDALSGIIAQLQSAQTSAEARQISNGLWALWTDAPDEKAQKLLDEGMQKLSQGDLRGSYDTLDALVMYCPDYAEGYNQRAYASYLQRDFAAALADLDRALAIVPNHVAALAGKGLTLTGLGREDEAQEVLKAAVALNPWLNERQLIKEPAGTDI